MPTITYTAGESGDIGIPLDDIAGAPLNMSGVSVRLRIRRGLLPDILIAGEVVAGEVFSDGVVRTHQSIASFRIAPANAPQNVRVYVMRVEVDSGDGWGTLSGYDFVLDVRN